MRAKREQGRKSKEHKCGARNVEERQSGDLPFRCCERKHDDGGGAATMCNEAAVSDDYDTAWA